MNLGNLGIEYLYEKIITFAITGNFLFTRNFVQKTLFTFTEETLIENFIFVQC